MRPREDPARGAHRGSGAASSAAARPPRKPGWRRGGRVALLGALAWAAACAADERQDRRPETWDAAAWRAEIRAHMASLEPLLPRLQQAARAEDSPELRELLRSARPTLERAEGSVPRVPWEAGIEESALSQRYTAALRELRYGVGMLLDALVRDDSGGEAEGRRFIVRGSEAFRTAHAAAGTGLAPADADSPGTMVAPSDGGPGGREP
jgi:hypothetical protein